MTPQELQTLRTDATVTKAAVVFQGETLLFLWNNTMSGTIADFYNQTTNPVTVIWRPNVVTQDLIDALVGTEYTAGTAQTDVARRNLLDLITRSQRIDATKAQVRANFAQAAGALTQVAWTAIAQKNATYIEALFTTAMISSRYGYRLSPEDVAAARDL